MIWLPIVLTVALLVIVAWPVQQPDHWGAMFAFKLIVCVAGIAVVWALYLAFVLGGIAARH